MSSCSSHGPTRRAFRARHRQHRADPWYFVPFVERIEAIASPGSRPRLPAGLLLYLLFHLFLKQPLIALPSPRLHAFTPAFPPAAPWHAGAPLAARRRAHPRRRDALTHSHDAGWRYNWLQHLEHRRRQPGAGLVDLGKLRRRPRRPGALSSGARRHPARARRHRRARRAARGGAALARSPALRQFLRTGGLAALEALGAALLVYRILFQRKMNRAGRRRQVEITRGVAGEMFAFYRELEGAAHLTLHAFKRVGTLRVPPVMEEFMRQVYFTGASATGGIVLRGAFIGTLIIAYVIDVLNADAALAVKMLLWVVLREVGPLIAAVLVIQRSGTAVATELALREISARSPACGACASTCTTTWWCRACTRWRCPTPRSRSTCSSSRSAAAWCSPPTCRRAARRDAHQFLPAGEPARPGVFVTKSLLFGGAIVVVACYHGLHPGSHSINAVPRAAICAVVEGLLLVMLPNVVFAMVYGTAFFGLINAEQ